MEGFLNSLNSLKQCYEGQEKQNILNNSSVDNKLVCLEERKQFLKILMDDKQMRTSNLINERVSILDSREANRFSQRREFLDASCK